MSDKDNSVPPLSFEIERQARIKRSLVIQACVRGPCARLRNGSAVSCCKAPSWRAA
jgi:bifunctional N-acetylglucosamine-1-phosphate-uridyltransferase/glucosamine-1-phosphate-acetyltransferase GlmU-like protein